MNSPKTPQDLTGDTPLADRIRGAAHNIAFEYGADPDDVESEITLAILETYADDPEFLNNTEAYIVNRGAWRARDVLKRECNLYVNRTVDGDASTADDGATLLELLPGETWAEVEFGFAVEQAMEALDDRDAQIARMYAGGWNASEIGDAVGCARRTVYYRLNHSVRDALEAQGLAQVGA